MSNKIEQAKLLAVAKIVLEAIDKRLSNQAGSKTIEQVAVEISSEYTDLVTPARIKTILDTPLRKLFE